MGSKPKKTVKRAFWPDNLEEDFCGKNYHPPKGKPFLFGAVSVTLFRNRIVKAGRQNYHGKTEENHFPSQLAVSFFGEEKYLPTAPKNQPKVLSCDGEVH